MKHKFVEFMPAELEDGVIYVSLEYGSARHKCCCGCGENVITPITPTDWKVTFDGETISLHPSVGNWNLSCRSHYVIKESKVIWASSWTEKQVMMGKLADQNLKEDHFNEKLKPRSRSLFHKIISMFKR